MYKDVHISDRCLYTDSQTAPDLRSQRAFYPYYVEYMERRMGYPDKENGLDKSDLGENIFMCSL